MNQKVQQQIEELKEELRGYNHSYYVLDESHISDFEFDIANDR